MVGRTSEFRIISFLFVWMSFTGVSFGQPPVSYRLNQSLQGCHAELVSASRQVQVVDKHYVSGTLSTSQLIRQVVSDTVPKAPASYHTNRLKWVVGSTAAIYAGGMTGLGLVWYEDFAGTSFHFFDDARQWKQLDKAGHVYAAWHLARTEAEALQWAGLSRPKAAWWGGGISFVMQSSIEIFDGFSPDYGASWSDIAANAAGAAAAALQYAHTDHEKVFFKFSFQTTRYAALRPNTLGSSLPEQILKDYNGQTYWLSVAPHDVGWRACPKWLSVATGYGAEGMLYARQQPNQRAGFSAYRQFYLSPDINWQAIPTRRRWLRRAFYVMNMVKIPAPALAYDTRGRWQLKPLYF